MQQKKVIKKKKILNTFGYAQLKKYISQYHKFNFKNPRKGKDFTRSQKSSITRQYNKLHDLIKAHRLQENSWIPTGNFAKKDIPKSDAIKTNKGIFFKFPYTTIKKVRPFNKAYAPSLELFTDFSLIRFSPKYGRVTTSDVTQIYIYIPEKNRQTLDDLIAYKNYILSIYIPDDYLMSIDGRKAASRLSLKEFFQNSGRAVLEVKDDEGNQVYDETNYFTGILLMYAESQRY